MRGREQTIFGIDFVGPSIHYAHYVADLNCHLISGAKDVIIMLAWVSSARIQAAIIVM